MFLPENSTHILQPLDVAVFGPMKAKWREVLASWKEECAANGDNYSTIQKHVRHTYPPIEKHTVGKVVPVR